MEVFLSINGKFPRSETLIRITRDFDRGRTSLQNLQKAFEQDYISLKNLQTGFKWVSDGLLCWQDIIRPFAKIVKDTMVGGLIRYYETNTFIRELHFKTDLVTIQDDWIKTYFRFGNLAILPGPFTFKRFTSGLSITQIFNILNRVAKTLHKSGYSVFYFQEPQIVYDVVSELPTDYKTFFADLKGELSNTTVIINTYFGSVIPIVEKLFDLNVDGIGIDFFETDVVKLSKIGWDDGKGIVSGIVNTMNSLIETTELLNPLFEVLVSKINPRFLVLTGRADFELLPRKVAEKKIKFLKTLVEPK